MAKKFLLIILVLIIAAGAFAACGDDTTEQTTTTTTKLSFDEIFENPDTGYTPPIFDAQSKASYALLLSDGTIEVREYGYEGDVVKELRQSIHLYIAELTEAQKQDVVDSMSTAFDDVASLNGVSVTTEIKDEYYIVSVHCTRLDDADTLKGLMDFGIVQKSEDTTLSMDTIDLILTSSGYVKQ